jgi:hypothetical protein
MPKKRFGARALPGYVRTVQGSLQGHVQTKLLLDDCYQDIDADGDPDLRPHSVLGSAVEAFDAQVLLDPLEKQFHLPSAPVPCDYKQGREAAKPKHTHDNLSWRTGTIRSL